MAMLFQLPIGGGHLGFVVMLSSLGVYGFIIGQIANFMSTLKEQRELGPEWHRTSKIMW
jgi:hypothetical protein